MSHRLKMLFNTVDLPAPLGPMMRLSCPALLPCLLQEYLELAVSNSSPLIVKSHFRGYASSTFLFSWTCFGVPRVSTAPSAMTFTSSLIEYHEFHVLLDEDYRLALLLEPKQDCLISCLTFGLTPAVGSSSISIVCGAIRARASSTSLVCP